METTFITIHNLARDANILFASESIVDILGYMPEDVINKTCFEYFHPDEELLARNVHSRGVQLDKAAVLHYARIRNRAGDYVICECVFTVVYQVLVACTSIYSGQGELTRRGVEAPAIRHLFASSPRDPRYHMLEHLSSKFRTAPRESLLEPRAALILNRFTRTLGVMYATSSVSTILSITPEQLHGKSFYECIQENCLTEAIRCLESAKSNDSIAYLRFWYRNPRTEEELEEEMREASQSSESVDSDDGGVEFTHHMDVDGGTGASHLGVPYASASGGFSASENVARDRLQNKSRTSGVSTGVVNSDSTGTIFDHGQTSSSSSSFIGVNSRDSYRQSRPNQPPTPAPSPDPAGAPFEIEAVVSCTSDGLVVVLRRARALVPSQPAGLFAAPWGINAIRPHVYQPDPLVPFRHGLDAQAAPPSGPAINDFMKSIQEVAVFAWSLTGINGNIASYGRGNPGGESQPPGGLPVWDPYAQPRPSYDPPRNQAVQRWARFARERSNKPMGGDKTSYQHLRQEGNLRQQQETFMRPIGSDPASTVRHHLTNQNTGLNYQSPRADQPYETRQAPPQNQWPHGSHGTSNNAPASDGSGQGGASKGNRNHWY
ncbi:putative aryl hydrocarbon receptor nuclear translocator-like protein 2 [Amylocarpus encephaloides]|uniref:Aryl hydrocarbon receptor nuclear translocator-like protein 2 n=1 Tax=Amylocarpus encephaloides TaxID=45428 RepID=A0A9P7YDN1_9HELO|nr:putative aryl hydrocarbon receptor nuclear translocator-like protein 2 [Amylocarpus encephaloides]